MFESSGNVNKNIYTAKFKCIYSNRQRASNRALGVQESVIIISYCLHFKDLYRSVCRHLVGVDRAIFIIPIWHRRSTDRDLNFSVRDDSVSGLRLMCWLQGTLHPWLLYLRAHTIVCILLKELINLQTLERVFNIVSVYM